MQRIAAWLVERPERAVLGMVATFLLPLTRIFGSAVLVLLTLQHGAKRAIVVATISFAVIAAVLLVMGTSLAQVAIVVVQIWLPGMVFAVLLQRTKSLTLMLQATVLIAIVVVGGIYLALGDPAAYWRELLLEFANVWREAGLEQEAALFDGLQPFAAQMTSIFVAIGWLMQVGVLLLGYSAYRQLPGETVNCGQFRDLDFGRVLAAVLVFASIAGAAAGALWMKNIAFVLFVVFWVQGLAILHWMRANGKLPAAALVVNYGILLVPGLNLLSVSAVAVLGYSDAWFDVRARMLKHK
jgi:hypothetical protein